VRGLTVLGSLWALCLAACPGAVDDPARFAVDPTTCADVERRIFRQRCAGAACHEQRKPAAGLDLASPGIFARLRIMQSEGCSRRKLLDELRPAESFVLQKLKEGVGCGERMPAGRKALTDDEIRCVVRWIERGGDPTDGGVGPTDGAPGDVDLGAADDGGADAADATTVNDAGEGG
jgi:hypothetical protein